MLEAVRLTSEANQRLHTYSGGMIRRVGIAQALLSNPQILVFDEPTVGLDPAERIRFRELIATLAGERIVVLSTHIISDIEAMATDIALIRQGEIRWHGSTTALLAYATNMAWTLTASIADIDKLRGACQVSTMIRQGQNAEVRLVSPVQPHPQARVVEPTLEEIYLYFMNDYLEMQSLNAQKL